MSPEQLQILLSQVSAEFTRKSSSTSDSANFVAPDLVDDQLSSDEHGADKADVGRDLPLEPEVDPILDAGSADGNLPVTLSPALEAADDADENVSGESEADDDSGDDDRSFPRRKKGSVAAMHGGAPNTTSKQKRKRQTIRKEVVQPVDRAQAAASDQQRTVELQQETLAGVRRQLEESQRANQLLQASRPASTSSALPVNVASTLRGLNDHRSTLAPAVAPGAVGRSLATSVIPALLAPNASRSLGTPLAYPGTPTPRPDAREPSTKLPESLTELTFFTAKCNQAVLYFVAEAPPREINFWPEPQELRQQLIRTYQLVNVSEETFNLVMNSHPERERILKDKVGERRGNLFTQVKTWAHGPGGFVRESKIPMLAAENMAPVQRRNVQQWHLFYFDRKYSARFNVACPEHFQPFFPEIHMYCAYIELISVLAAVYGSKWHCDPDTGRPFANKAFDMALCKGLGGRRCKTMFAKIPVVATICHVVEWPMANAGSRDTPALDGSDSNNRREVQLKVGVIIDWIKDRLSRGDNIYRDTAPAGFQMGANPLVRIVIAGFEDEFAGLLPGTLVF
ncbi:unnamed protein product [Closterium sp. NIES-64]|nr:unnamed protein product [Closterium sp. NIES-64]CAI5957977.1 unnamed protein product [Closterium sp. NIES-65]CAI5985983.1 unnamed protein product [Closterium sp. NIES-65]CAI6007987.1 unnamed protein product [Closterium sp. NIES-65]